MYLIRRGNFFHIYYRDSNNKQKTKSTKCKRKKDAAIFSAKFFKELSAGKIDQIVYERFAEIYKLRAKSIYSENYCTHIYYAFDQFGKVVKGMKLKDIRPRHVEQFKQLKISEASESCKDPGYKLAGVFYLSLGISGSEMNCKNFLVNVFTLISISLKNEIGFGLS